MPVYVYHCDECGFQFEQQQKFTDNPLKTCPDCGKQTLHKVYTPVGIIYKGSGFYSTDHRSKSGAVSPTKKSSETTSSDDKSAVEPKQEKKPKAEKSTTK